MVYTEHAPRWQQLHVAPAINNQTVLKYTTSVGIKRCVAELHQTTAHWLCWEAENSAIEGAVKCLGLNLR